MLTAPSRGRASTAEPRQGWGPKTSSQAGQGDPSKTEGQSEKKTRQSCSGATEPRTHYDPSSSFVLQMRDEGLSHCKYSTGDSKRPKLGQLTFWSCRAHSPPMSLACSSPKQVLDPILHSTRPGVAGLGRVQSSQAREAAPRKGSTGKSGKNPAPCPGLSPVSFSPAKSWFS